MATLAPSAASRLAIAAPIPREPPVTTETLPANFCPLLLLIYFVLSLLCVVFVCQISALPPSTNGPMPGFANLIVRDTKISFVSWLIEYQDFRVVSVLVFTTQFPQAGKVEPHR